MSKNEIEEIKLMLNQILAYFDQQERHIARIEWEVEGAHDDGQPVTSAEFETTDAVHRLVSMMETKRKEGKL